MNSILESLYNCAMENRYKRYLTHDEQQNYYSSLSAKEAQECQLEKLLEGSLLKEFKLYVDNSEEAHWIDTISAFRKGLSMGLRLGAFFLPDD